MRDRKPVRVLSADEWRRQRLQLAEEGGKHAIEAELSPPSRAGEAEGVQIGAGFFGKRSQHRDEGGKVVGGGDLTEGAGANYADIVNYAVFALIKMGGQA